MDATTGLVVSAIVTQIGALAVGWWTARQARLLREDTAKVARKLRKETRRVEAVAAAIASEAKAVQAAVAQVTNRP